MERDILDFPTSRFIEGIGRQNGKGERKLWRWKMRWTFQWHTLKRVGVYVVISDIAPCEDRGSSVWSTKWVSWIHDIFHRGQLNYQLRGTKLCLEQCIEQFQLTLHLCISVRQSGKSKLRIINPGATEMQTKATEIQSGCMRRMLTS